MASDGMTGLAATLLSLAVLGAFGLTIGAVALFRRGERKKAMLMLVLVAVLAVNIFIWTLPTPAR